MRPMTMLDIGRLRGRAVPGTHLDRYERAHEADVSAVLAVECPHCKAKRYEQCKACTCCKQFGGRQ